MEAQDAATSASGFQYSNGYTTSNSRDETGAVSHEGSFLNADGGGGGGDKPKVKTQTTNNTATYTAGAAAMAQRTGIGMGSAVLEGGFGIGEGIALGGEVAAGSTGIGLLLMAGAYAIANPIDLTDGITDVGTQSNNSIGVQYRLVANKDGWFPDYKHKSQGGFGLDLPVAFTFLKKGETFKIGETMQWNAATQAQNRYPQSLLNSWGVLFRAEFQGIQAAIKVKEGQELIKYVMKHNFYLPPGNLMFK